MATCLVALGGNLTDTAARLQQALEALHRLPQTRLLRNSTTHRTRPAGGPAGQADYLNAAVLLETELPPYQLLQQLKQLEQQLGRQAAPRWDARAIDLDLLLYDEQIVHDTDLIVPHPRMSFRRFVLDPAREIAPGMMHPSIGRTIEELALHLDQSPPLVALAGLPLERKRQLAKAAVARLRNCILMEPSELDASRTPWSHAPRSDGERMFLITGWSGQATVDAQYSEVIVKASYDDAAPCDNAAGAIVPRVVVLVLFTSLDETSRRWQREVQQQVERLATPRLIVSERATRPTAEEEIAAVVEASR